MFWSKYQLIRGRIQTGRSKPVYQFSVNDLYLYHAWLDVTDLMCQKQWHWVVCLCQNIDRFSTTWRLIFASRYTIKEIHVLNTTSAWYSATLYQILQLSKDCIATKSAVQYTSNSTWHNIAEQHWRVIPYMLHWLSVYWKILRLKWEFLKESETVVEHTWT